MTNELIEAMARAVYDAIEVGEDAENIARAAIAAAEASGYRLVPDNWTREWAHELALLRGCSYEGAVTLIYEVLAAAPDHVEGVRKKVSPWIPVSERLPSGDRFVLVCVNDNKQPPYVGACWFYQDMSDIEAYFEADHVTHWMPLPSPPDHIADDSKKEGEVTKKQAP